MSDFRNAFKALRPSVVGLGFWRDPGFEIIGTGFILTESGLVATNAHVVEALIDSTANTIRPGAAVFLFTLTNPQAGATSAAGLAIARIAQAALVREAPTPPPPQPPLFRGKHPYQAIPLDDLDLGVVKFLPSTLPSEFTPLKPATIVSSAAVCEGTSVATLGFPQGISHSGTYSSASEVQLSPLLQVGVVSALLPMSEISNPDQFVLDILINPGCSGSPVFLESGDVIGIVFATRIGFLELETPELDGTFTADTQGRGVRTPNGLGLAAPSDRFPAGWRSP